MTEAPNDLSQMLYGSLSLIVNQVALDSRVTPAVVLVHVAAKLGRFLIPSHAVQPRVMIAWRGRGWSIGVEWRSGISDPRELNPGEMVMLAERLAAPYVEYKTWDPVSIWWWGEDRHALRIGLSATQDRGALEIHYIEDPCPNERWSWFVMYVRGLRELHHIVHGLLVVRIAMLKERYNSKVQAFCYMRAISLHANLAEAMKLLPQLMEIGAADLIEELLTSLVLQIFGTGWRVRTIPRMPIASEGEFPGTLAKQLADSVRRYIVDVDSPHRFRLLSLADCINAVIAPTVAPVHVPSNTGDEVFAMLARWARVHELSRGLRRAADLQVAADAAWTTVSAETIPLLVRKLAKPIEDGIPLQHARNWLLMWFCLEILNREREKQTQDTESWYDLRAELAYALREAFRLDLFGSRVDCFQDVSTLVNAVAHLVEYHATGVLGIPSAYQIGVLMKFIDSDAGTQSTLEHLQHVTDIYIAGHFLLSLKVCRNEEIATVERMFAGTDLPGVMAKYRQAFSMAAIFHDVGHILLPSGLSIYGESVLRNASVNEVLESHNSASKTSAVDVTSICVKQLGLDLVGSKPEQRRRGPVYFEDPNDAEKVIAHFGQQAGAGHMNHGLLGAWYLHRVCAHAEGLKHEDEGMRECRVMAVRAILLHDTVTMEIDTDRDPVAALLVTCNEVFEWSPRRLAMERASSRTRFVQGVNSPSYRMDRSIEIREFSCADVSLSSSTRFEAMINARNGTWPVVVVQLVAPEYLDGPVLRLWLAKAQAMGRIRPGAKTGFSPQLRIRSALAPEFVQCNVHTRSALKRALYNARLLPEIVEWCKPEERFKYKNEKDRQFEEVRLGYLGKQIYDGDIEEQIPDIVRTVEDYLERLEREPSESYLHYP